MNLPALIVFVSFAIQNADIPAKYQVKAPSRDTPIAKVDGVVVKASEVEDLLWEWRGREALADIISYKMIKAAADKAKVSVTDEDVDNAMAEQMTQLTPNVTGGKKPEDYLLDQGFTKSRLFLRVKTDLLLNQLAAVGFKADEYVKISTIIVKPDSISSSSLTAAIRKADLFYEKLTKGDSWESVLALSTTDERTLKAKGIVGWRRMDAFPKEVRDLFPTLKTGGYTKPVQTQNGIQIFKIDMWGKDATGDDREEAREIHAQSNKSQILQKIRDEVKVERLWQNSGASGS